MDLLEYQGKQLFAKHGVAVPSGEVAKTVDEAVAAAEQIGYPCAIKAQVLIGGRGKAGGIKIASDQAQAREYADAILGMDIVGPHGEGPFRVDQVWIEGGSDIASEYYASVILDRGEKKLLAMVSSQGGMDIEQVAAESPEALVKVHIDPTREFDAAAAGEIIDRRRARRGHPRPGRRGAGEAGRGRDQRGRQPDRGQPADRHQRPAGRRPRRQGHDRRQRALPPPGLGRDRRHGRRSPGADGEGQGPHLRQARRQRRHPRQRRRSLYVDARRRRPGGRRPGQLPRRRRRLQSRGDRQRAGSDHVRREGQRDPLQHLRRHHPLRRDRQGHRRPPRASSNSTCRWSFASTAPTPRRAWRSSPRPTCPTCTRRRRCWTPPAASSSSPGEPHEHHRRQRDEAGRLRPDRPRGLLPRAAQPRLRDRPRRWRHPRQGRPGRRGRAGLRHDQGGRRRGRRQHLDDLRAGALRRRRRSTRRSTPASRP